MMTLQKKYISLNQGILTQTSSVLGVSIILYPYTYSQLGYLLSTIFTIFMCILSGFTLYLLARCSKQINLTKLDELILYVSGSFISILGISILYLSSILPLIFYLKISVEFLSCISLYVGINTEKTILTVLLTTVNTILCIFYMDASKLEFISILSLISLLIFVLYIILDFFTYFENINFCNLKKVNINYRSLNSLSYIIFVFFSHTSFLPIVECLETIQISLKVIIYSNLISTITYIVVGYIGFCVFPATNKNYLENTSGYTFMKIILMFFMAAVNVLSFPLMMIPARLNIISFINFVYLFRTNYKFEVFNIMLNSLVTFVCFNLLGNSDMLDGLYVIVGSFTMFIIPVYLFLMIVKDVGIVEKVLAITSLFLAFFGIYMGIKIICK